MTIPFEAYRSIIPDFSLFKEALHRPLPTHLRLNPIKTDLDSLITKLEKMGIRIERSTNDSDILYKAAELKSPGRLMEYSLGYIHPQALTSCLAAIALSPKKNAYVLDMCASPGGKTSHLAQLLQNSGLIVANELYPSRQVPLGHTLNRLGIVNTVITGYQAQQFPLNQKFDYILADVPCSAEGKFRKLNDDYVYTERNSKRQLPVLQKKIVLRGYDLLKVGGEMLYATCTYNPEENESVIDFLLKHRDVALLPIELKTKHEPGIVQWRKKEYDRKLRLATRYYPHQTDSVGFFMAKIVRKG